MKPNLLKTCVPLSALCLLSGCIDNKYDLSDIDKTTQINVNDLVIPVNIDAIELSDIIDLDDDSKIKIVKVNGQDVYAVTQEGTISSNEINVSAFTASKPVINPAYATFSINSAASRALTETFEYSLKESETQDVSFTASNVDKAVKQITALQFKPMEIVMNMTASGLDANSTLELPKVTFNFLKGLVIPNLPSNYTYDDVNGILEVTNLPYTDKATIKLTATGLDFAKAEASLVNQEFIFDSGVSLRDGEMKLHVSYEAGETPSAADEIEFTLVTDVNELEATYFSGVIEYNLEGENLNIEPVSLSDLPDFLSDEKTDLILANPQIYLNLNNPVAGYKLGFETGLQLTSVRGEEREEFDPEDKVEVGYNHGVAGPYNFVISPTMPTSVPADFEENITPVKFTSLSNVLAGDGLPESLEINLVDPKLPTQSVDNFKLGSAIPGVEGKYEFLAPLALKTGSLIIYSSTEDGWSDDDLDKLTIKTLSVDADATSTLPLGAELYIHPLDKNGNSIPGVTVTPAEIAAFADNVHITMLVSGDIRELDGVKIEAVVRPASDETLAPTQTISLKNVRAKVSGYYLTDFE